MNKKSMVVALTILAVLGSAGGVAAAAPIAPITQQDGTVLVLTPSIVKIITGVLLPFLVAAVTKYNGSKTIKAVVGIVVAAVVATVERALAVDGSAVFSESLVVDMVTLYGVQVLTYFGLWRAVNINARIAPEVGVG